MTQETIFKNYLDLIEEPDGMDTSGELEEIELLLASPDAVHRRIIYLESLGEACGEYGDSRTAKTITNPLSRDKLNHCARKGIVGAYDEKEISREDVYRLLHSIDGLRAFTQSLAESPDDKLAPCWKFALIPEFKPAEIHLPAIYASTAAENIWAKITSMASDWLESILPPAMQPALGFRGASTKTELTGFNRSGFVVRRERIMEQLRTLENLPVDRIPTELSDTWNLIPWNEIRGCLTEGITWERFLSDAGRSLKSGMDGGSMAFMKEFINDGGFDPGAYTSEMKLLALLFKSSELNGQ